MPNKAYINFKDAPSEKVPHIKKTMLSNKQAFGGATFDLPNPPAMKAKEWSPIDRMLANKRGSKSPKHRQQASDNDLPPLNRNSPVHNASTQVQTSSWNSLLAEALAPERQKCAALQGEIKALRAQIKEREREREHEGEECTRQLEQQWLDDRARLEAEISALRSDRDAALAESEAEKLRRQELELELKKHLDSANESARNDREDACFLREELGKSQSDVKGLQKQIAALRAENAAVAQERDRALQQLEEEQSKMMARVDAMEQRLTQRAM
jgi:chromosome segregation ATPase